MRTDPYEEGVIANAGWTNRVLTSGAGAAGSMVVLKLLGLEEFSWEGIAISTDAAWILISGLTLAHLYCCFLLLRSTYLLWQNSKPETRLVVFRRISELGGLFMRGLEPRTESYHTRFGLRLYRMKAADLTTHISLGGVFLIVAAIVPFSTASMPKLVGGLLAGCVLAGLNWLIGSSWSIALSELTLPKERAVYYSRLEALGGQFEFELFGNPSDGCLVGLGYWVLPIALLGLGWLVYLGVRNLLILGLH